MQNIVNLIKNMFTTERVTEELFTVFSNELNEDSSSVIKFVEHMDDLSDEITYQAINEDNQEEILSVNLNFSTCVKKIRLIKLVIEYRPIQDTFVSVDLQLGKYADFDLFLRTNYSFISSTEASIYDYELMYSRYKID